MNKKILIVEDEEDMRALLNYRLETSGYDVFLASDGLEGMKEAKQLSPDLIILDLMMPRMGGYEFCSILKTDKKFQHIPILIFSARAGDSDRSIGFNCGADDYMAKPFNSDVLLNKIQRLLNVKPVS